MGMFTLGFLGDRIGRKWGSVTTVAIMLVGAITSSFHSIALIESTVWLS